MNIYHVFHVHFQVLYKMVAPMRVPSYLSIILFIYFYYWLFLHIQKTLLEMQSLASSDFKLTLDIAETALP